VKGKGEALMERLNIICNKKYFPIIGFLIGVTSFIIVYGVRILNPCFVDWLFGHGDLSQHYFGWEFYRRSGWHFPIGMTDNLAYPIQTSIIFTDSIPIFAVFFKVWNGVLPEYFQYFGLWGLICFGLQGYFSIKIFRDLKLNLISTLAGTVVLIFSPIVIYRMFMHTSLSAQWLILVSIDMLIQHKKNYKKLKKSIIQWGILGFLVSGIHFYFFPMCFLFVTAYVIQSIIEQKKIQYFMPMAAYILGTLFNFWVLGGFTSSAATNAFGLGNFSFNLNSFFNPRGYSNLLPELGECFSGMQQEGFAYLGVGIICLLIICILQCTAFGIFKQRKLRIHYSSIILFGIGVISIIWALSPIITFGDRKLFELPLPQKVTDLWAVFRSTGRLVWPAYYLITIYCVKFVAELKNSSGTILVILCVCLQIFDIHGILNAKHQKFSKNVVYVNNDENFWQSLTTYRDFNYLNISFQEERIDYYMTLAAIALKHDLSMNVFYFAREIDGMKENMTQLEREDAKSDGIYVFLPEQIDLMEDHKHELKYYKVSDFVVGVTWLDDTGKVNDFDY